MEGWTERTDWEGKNSFYQELAMPFLGESPQRPVGTWRMRKGKPHRLHRQCVVETGTSSCTFWREGLVFFRPLHCFQEAESQKAVAIGQLRGGEDLTEAEVRERQGENERERD